MRYLLLVMLLTACKVYPVAKRFTLVECGITTDCESKFYFDQLDACVEMKTNAVAIANKEGIRLTYSCDDSKASQNETVGLGE